MSFGTVTLTPWEMTVGALAGVWRNIAEIRRPIGYAGVDNRERGWEDNCTGGIGEVVVAKVLNLYLNPTPNLYRSAPDVGKYHVRCTPYKGGRLVLRPRDDVKGIYVLVLAHDQPTYHVAGWAYGEEVVKEEWLTDFGKKERGTCWALPQERLRDLMTLPGIRDEPNHPRP